LSLPVAVNDNMPITLWGGLLADPQCFLRRVSIGVQTPDRRPKFDPLLT
jgi:hypothetical protein